MYLYNLLAFHMVKDPKEIDAKVCDIKVKTGDALVTISESLHSIKMDNFQCGGDDLGAGRSEELQKFKLMRDQVEIFAS